jgi:5-methylcytosine-specific restriction endonuclease McrA
MPYKDPNKRKESTRNYYLKNRDKIIAKERLVYSRNTEKKKQYGKDYYQKHKIPKIFPTDNQKRYWESLKGKKPWNWKGLTPENKRIRNSIDYRLWRKSCFIRDNYICQKTGISGGYLVAHHINNFAEFPELRFAIDNGITLSLKAHKEFHKKYGMKNNTKEQLEEFLQA